MTLHTIDWVIVVLTLLICFVPALFFGSRAGKNTSEFFASGPLGSVVAGGAVDGRDDVQQRHAELGDAAGAAVRRRRQLAMVGVRADRRGDGVFLCAAVAPLRRDDRPRVLRAAVLGHGRRRSSAASAPSTSGCSSTASSWAMVTLAACKIANILFGLPPWQTILICGVLNVVFAAHSGLWGVLVIDMVQFFIKMTAVIAAAYFSLKEVARHTGVGNSALSGLHELVACSARSRSTTRRRSRCCRRSTAAASRSSTCCRTSR